MELRDALEQALREAYVFSPADLQAMIRRLDLTPERVAPWVAEPRRRLTAVPRFIWPTAWKPY
ncbi:hypothetical protein LJK87_27280 [Paenibacillus sp. P25]|nr:hypothetical protein LJK87_27280 [Paenibacillus sp. P25]